MVRINIGYTFTLWCFWMFSALNGNAQHRRPNFIFIYSDDQRYDALGVNGNSIISTPELDRLASMGIRFTNANVVFSLCSPSRAALLTGRYGSTNGVLQLNSDLNPDEKTIAQYLKENGYLTGVSGKWHLGRSPGEAGFDFAVWFKGNGTYYGRTINDEGKELSPEMHCDLYCAKRSVDFLKEAAKGEKPFFLFHNTQTPHMNDKLIWDARVETTKKYNVSEMPVAKNRFDDLHAKPDYLKQVRNRIQAKQYDYPDSLAIQQHTLEYYSVITEMDQFLGHLFRYIEVLGLLENTYVFFMSDNGWMLGDHGFTSKVLPYRPSSRVPFFMVGPGIKPSVNHHLVLNTDMAPTLLELAKIDIPSGIHGKSIMPLVEGKNKEWRTSFIYEGMGTYGGVSPNLAVISQDYRYIVTYKNNSLQQPVYYELYDQRNDSLEMKNLYGIFAYKEVIREFDEIIDKHIKSYILQ